MLTFVPHSQRGKALADPTFGECGWETVYEADRTWFAAWCLAIGQSLG
jgi:hypothetical protein